MTNHHFIKAINLQLKTTLKVRRIALSFTALFEKETIKLTLFTFTA